MQAPSFYAVTPLCLLSARSNPDMSPWRPHSLLRVVPASWRTPRARVRTDGHHLSQHLLLVSPWTWPQPSPCWKGGSTRPVFCVARASCPGLAPGRPVRPSDSA